MSNFARQRRYLYSFRSSQFIKESQIVNRRYFPQAIVNRRDFLAGLSASLTIPFTSSIGKSKMQAKELLKPKALKQGDTVGLITPSTEVIDPDRLALAAKTLKFFGLNARLGNNVGKRST